MENETRSDGRIVERKKSRPKTVAIENSRKTRRTVERKKVQLKLSSFFTPYLGLVRVNSARVRDSVIPHCSDYSIHAVFLMHAIR